MAGQTLDHPDPDRLAAFGRGILDHDEMNEAERHLAVCESCYQVLSTLPSDEFVGMLRTAQKQAELAATPWGASNPTSTAPVISDVPDSGIPPSCVLQGAGSASDVGATLAPGNLCGSESPE